VPRSRGGATEFENLAWACPSCNLHKSNRVEFPLFGKMVRLFHPRQDDWKEHFRWKGFEIVGCSGIGRATAEALQWNHERRLRIRQAEQLFGLFPPDEV